MLIYVAFLILNHRSINLFSLSHDLSLATIFNGLLFDQLNLHTCDVRIVTNATVPFSAFRRCNRLSESIKHCKYLRSESSLSKKRSLFVSPFASASLASLPSSVEFDESAGNDYRGKKHRKEIHSHRSPLFLSPRRDSFFSSLVIIITDARVRASAMERVGRRTAPRRRRRMWSSRRVWSDVCPVCGEMRKTGSLYVLHARRLSKAGVPSLRAAVAYACVCACAYHGDTNVRDRVQSRASCYVRCCYTIPCYEVPFSLFVTLGSLPRERALITPRDARTRVSRRCKVTGGH